jgi:hypothetical protein
MMNLYEFTLLFALPDATANPARFVDALYEAGCDDAVVGIGKQGSIAMEFSRSAGSADEAVGSAIDAVTRAIPGATLIEAKPDLVDLSELAAAAGFSRQNMRKYATGAIRGIQQPFPHPVYSGSPSLWHLCDIGAWLTHVARIPLQQEILDVSTVTYVINTKMSHDRHKYGIYRTWQPKISGDAVVEKRRFRSLPAERALTNIEQNFEPIYAGVD